jgi:hypothetical protein
MDHVQRNLQAATLVVLAVVLVACSQSSIRLGWVETSSPGHLKATYAEFTGTEARTVLVQPGKTLYLEYDAKVDQGSLLLEVEDPYGKPVWCVSLCEDCGETKALPVNSAGCYTVSVQGKAAKGGFDLKWEQK